MSNRGYKELHTNQSYISVIFRNSICGELPFIVQTIARAGVRSGHDRSNFGCLLYPWKRTLIGLCRMSASLIGRLGSSAFRLSTTTVSMSLTGSCFFRNRHQRGWRHGMRAKSYFGNRRDNILLLLDHRQGQTGVLAPTTTA